MENWQIEFDTKFPQIRVWNIHDIPAYSSSRPVKDFISSLLTSQKQHYKERVMDMLEEMPQGEITHYSPIGQRVKITKFPKTRDDLKSKALDIFGEGEELK